MALRVRAASGLLGLIIAASSVSAIPALADDDNEKQSNQTEQAVDCEDPDNAVLDECKLPTSTSAPPSVSSEGPPPGSQTDQPKPPATSTQTEQPKPPTTGGQNSETNTSTAAQAPSGPRSPLDVLFTLADAGKQATEYAHEEKSDARGSSAHARYERRDDTGSADTLGPRVIDHTVYVARDEATARQIFKDEAAKNDKFPEQASGDPRSGSYAWNLENLVDETAAMSACNDCNGKDQLFLHHRIVQRKGNVVSVIYLYGREKRGNEEITTQAASVMWARMAADRL